VRGVYGEGAVRTGVRCQVSGIRWRGIALLAGLVAGLLPAGRAVAQVSDGCLLTNIAMASFRAADNPVMQTTSYNVTAWVLVYNPAIAMRKISTPSMQCSGGTVTFCIYVVNTSAMSSAFNVIVEDIMPGDGAGMGLAYLTGRDSWNPQGAAIVLGYRNGWGLPVIPIWAGFAADPDGEPDNGMVGTYYIRWGISVIGPNRSMMVCFKATVL
jgi:hypothetical protein